MVQFFSQINMYVDNIIIIIHNSYIHYKIPQFLSSNRSLNKNSIQFSLYKSRKLWI